MNVIERLAQRFEAHRPHLRAVAFRMLGSASEADDAVQEAWLRLSRAGADDVENLRGWLTTVVARVCLDMLRSQRSRREEPLDAHAPNAVEDGDDPEHEAQLADAVGHAMLVVLDTLPPAERVAFVLHDMFELPFDEIAAIVGRTPVAARQLASRARRRVQGATTVSQRDFARKLAVVEAFLTASREGDFDGLLAVLDPDVVVRCDAQAVRMGAAPEYHGGRIVAEHFNKRARLAVPALVDGEVGVLVPLKDRPLLVFRVAITGERIVGIEVYGAPDRLARFKVEAIAR